MDEERIVEETAVDTEQEESEVELDSDDLLDALQALEEEEKQEQLQKNKNAEEARKRREQKQKLEKQQAMQETEQSEESEQESILKQVEDLKTKYPEVEVEKLNNDKDFVEYIDGRWGKGGKTLTELYESYTSLVARLTQSKTEKVKATPSLKGASSVGGNDDYYTKEELATLRVKMPYMTTKQYNAVAEKYKQSIKYHKGE